MKRIALLLFLVVILSAGCEPTAIAPAGRTNAPLTDVPVAALSLATTTALPSDTPTVVAPTQTATAVPTTVAPTATLAPMQIPTAGVPRTGAKVVRVVDGDTIQVSIDGKTYTVRYIGMDTPETVAPNTPVQWMGPEATAANKALVEGKTVALGKDVSETDRYGRLLRYVYVGDVFVNAELVRQGYAQVSTYPPDVKYQSLFLQMQQEARAAGRGLWGPGPTALAPTKPPATLTRAPTVTRAPTAPASTVSQELVSLTSPIAHGANATITVRTAPGVNCSITVYYKSGASTAQGLGPKTAGSNGLCSWTWVVGSRTTPGTWRIVVTTGATTREYPFVVQ